MRGLDPEPNYENRPLFRTGSIDFNPDQCRRDILLVLYVVGFYRLTIGTLLKRGVSSGR